MEPAAARACKPERTVNSVLRAMEVLSCFSTNHLEWGVSEVAEYLGWYKSAAHRFLRSLEQSGYVERTLDHRYRLGIRALELGNIYSFQTRLLQIAERPLRLLAAQTGFSAHLAQLNGRDVLELLKVSSKEDSLRPPTRVLRKPAHASALGKVLLAFGPRESLEHYIGIRRTLERYTNNTILRPDGFRVHLQRVVVRGYAIDCGECSPERFCLAVPVCDCRSPLVKVAISVSTSSTRFDQTNCMKYLPALVRAAHHIGESGFR